MVTTRGRQPALVSEQAVTKNLNLNDPPILVGKLGAFILWRSRGVVESLFHRNRPVILCVKSHAKFGIFALSRTLEFES